MLRAVHYRGVAGVEPDERTVEAINVVESTRDSDRWWPFQITRAGAVHFELEGADGKPSRRNTLRAMRVLRCYRG